MSVTAEQLPPHSCSPAAGTASKELLGLGHGCEPRRLLAGLGRCGLGGSGARGGDGWRRDNFRLLAGSKLRELIYSQVGYDPTKVNAKRFEKWHERIALNYQSAPKGFFHVFNEAHTVIYELIQAGAEIGEHFVVDISIGQHWSKHWTDNELDQAFGGRCKIPASVS
jgi:hypothetical protein